MTLTRFLLACGVAAALLYLAMDVVAAAFLYPGYDVTSQQVSELSAIGAPSRDVWMALTYPYAALLVLFAAGVWRAATWRTPLRVAGALLGLFALNAFLWGYVAPMHMRGETFTGTDALHLWFAVSAVVLMLGFMGLAANALGPGFRIYSAITVGAMLAAGSVVGTQVEKIAANVPTPGMGLLERVSVHGAMLWIAVFAIVLLRERQGARAPRRGSFSASPAPGR